ncbi:CD82 antigen [Takifugu rubripes]|uniref:Tetraspanin n=1 Tax=Takifugu rubripes TaxID=31033 RepID=H2T9E4_TAKRU|nr:CD82 antigen-like [Takifugu rubripes]
MKAELAIQLLKFCFQIFNFIFLVLGVSVLSCSLWILFSSGHLLNVLPSDEVRIVGTGLLLIGGLVVLVSVLGSIGANREKVLLLMMYLGLLIVLVLGQLFITLLLLINRDKIERRVDDTVDQLISQYDPDGTSQNHLLDSVQKQGRCCGRTGPSDWLTNSFIQNRTIPDILPDILPCSCFNASHPSATLCCSDREPTAHLLIGQGDSLYEQGCKSRVSEWLQQNVLTIAGMGFALIFIQVVQSLVAVYLWRVIGRRVGSTGSHVLKDPDRAHLDPIPQEHMDEYVDDTLKNDGFIELQKNT